MRGSAIAAAPPGVGAAERGDFAAAHVRLASAYDHLDAVARRAALLALAALDLDPRNLARDPSRAPARFASFLRSPHSAGDPVRPVAATLYLLARQLGGPAHATGATDAVMPELPDSSLTLRLARLRHERDSLRLDLAEAEVELTRIRKLLKK